MSFSFDGPNRRISISSATTISLRDLWSRWVDWWLTSDNSKYLPAFSQVGGNDIDLLAGTYIPVYLFLLNGWRIKPQESSHTLNVQDGVVVVEGGGDPFVDTNGVYTVRINYQQPVQAITVATGGGASVDPWAGEMESGHTYAEAMRIMLAALAGDCTVTDNGNGTYTLAFKSVDGMITRITGTANTAGERSGTILDGS